VNPYQDLPQDGAVFDRVLTQPVVAGFVSVHIDLYMLEGGRGAGAVNLLVASGGGPIGPH